MLEKIKRYQFLFSELVKRDFTKKYKRTMLGMAWSILSPLMTLLINATNGTPTRTFRPYVDCAVAATVATPPAMSATSPNRASVTRR